MKEALVIFGSTTGNTEIVATYFKDFFKTRGIEIHLKDVVHTTPNDLLSYNGLILLGCSTWGEEEIGFQEDFESFHDELKKVDLSGKQVVVFGCGDSGYIHFCGAVDELETTLKGSGAEVVYPSLKVDGDPEASFDDISEWLRGLAASLE